MLEKFAGSGLMYWYAIAPGDATRYRFGFMPLERMMVHYPEMADDVIIQRAGSAAAAHITGMDELFPGTEKGIGYTLVVVAMNPSGCYEMRNSMLRNPTSGDVAYFASHAGINPYTAAAVLLALSVLLDDKDDLAGAAKAMLRAPELLL